MRAICPKCNKEISYLDFCSSGTTGGRFYDNGYWDKVYEIDKIGFFCPKCLKELFTDDEEALKFLKGGEHGLRREVG